MVVKARGSCEALRDSLGVLLEGEEGFDFDSIMSPEKQKKCSAMSLKALIVGGSKGRFVAGHAFTVSENDLLTFKYNSPSVRPNSGFIGRTVGLSCTHRQNGFLLHSRKALDWNLGEVGVHAQTYNFDRSFS
jgi:hypothetical protein